jgi:DNA-binding MarR family transcriptional regulator
MLSLMTPRRTKEPVAALADREDSADTSTGGADAILEGVEQYSALLDSDDSLSIAIILTLWEANYVQMLANHRAFDAIGLPISLSGARLTILRTLYFAQDRRMSLSAMGKKTDKNLTVVSNLVDALERGGLVRRVGSSDDRRVSIAELTPAGEEAFRRILPVMSARMSAACKDFTEPEKRLFLEFLQRLL